jgi:hypothetical protein
MAFIAQPFGLDHAGKLYPGGGPKLAFEFRALAAQRLFPKNSVISWKMTSFEMSAKTKNRPKRRQTRLSKR